MHAATHSVLRYAEWREVISDYVGVRLGVPSDDVTPRLVGQLWLAVALTAYDQWLEQPNASLRTLLEGCKNALLAHVEP